MKNLKKCLAIALTIAVVGSSFSTVPVEAKSKSGGGINSPVPRR